MSSNEHTGAKKEELVRCRAPPVPSWTKCTQHTTSSFRPTRRSQELIPLFQDVNQAAAAVSSSVTLNKLLDFSKHVVLQYPFEYNEGGVARIKLPPNTPLIYGRQNLLVQVLHVRRNQLLSEQMLPVVDFYEKAVAKSVKQIAGGGSKLVFRRSSSYGSAPGATSRNTTSSGAASPLSCSARPDYYSAAL